MATCRSNGKKQVLSVKPSSPAKGESARMCDRPVKQWCPNHPTVLKSSPPRVGPKGAIE